MKLLMPLALLGIALLSACANPLNQVTSDNYAETCSTAKANGRLEVAEQACYRALVNVDWGNLGPELKSQRLYNLGRIKRQLSKFSEAEQLFKESLSIEEKHSELSGIKVGRRLVELSVSLAGQDKWPEGVQFVERLLPIADQFSGQERTYTAKVLTEYSKQLRSKNDISTAERFEAKALALQ